MRIVTLLENKTIHPKLKAKHGLSIYLEANGKKILCDTGPDRSFIKNANKMGISIEDIDLLFISHAHYDHGGGLKDFLRYNKHADVYLSHKAFNYYASHISKIYVHIGLDKKLANHPRLHLIHNDVKIDSNIHIVGPVSTCNKSSFVPAGNKNLLMKNENGYEPDTFQHEIYLLVEEDEKQILFTGCSHAGITNILEHVRHQTGKTPSHIIGGMHLYSPAKKRYEDSEIIAELSNDLMTYDFRKFYTCHCTGEKAFQACKSIIGSRMDMIHTGSNFEL